MDASELPPLAGTDTKKKGLKKLASKMTRTFSFTRSASTDNLSRIGSQTDVTAEAESTDSRDAGEDASQHASPRSPSPAAPASADGRAEPGVAALQAEMAALQASNTELALALASAREMARDLHSRASVAEDSRGAASQTLLSLTQRAAVLESEKQALAVQLQTQAETVDKAVAVEQEANDAVFGLTQQLAERDAEVARLQGEVASLAAQLEAEEARRQDEVDSLQAASAGKEAAAKQTAEELAAQLEAAQAERAGLQAQLAAAEARVAVEAAAKAQIDEAARDAIADLSQQLEAVQAEGAAARERVVAVERERDVAATDRDAFQRQVSEAHAGKAAADQLVASLRGQLDGGKGVAGSEPVALAALLQQLQAADSRIAELEAAADGPPPAPSLPAGGTRMRVTAVRPAGAPAKDQSAGVGLPPLLSAGRWVLALGVAALLGTAASAKRRQ